MLIIAPRIDLNGERWFTPMLKMKPVKGLRLKVACIDNHQYRTRNSMVRRHIDRLDATYNVGTKEFNPQSIEGEIDSLDDLLIDTCAAFLLLDWEGVGELVDGEEKAIEYTPEKGAALLKQNPEFYWQVLGQASEIAQGKKQQADKTVKKP